MKAVLSIDGGGIRGLIAAVVLEYIERQLGKPLSESFDLIAGTSTGGIIAAGLSTSDPEGNPMFTASDIVSFYMEDSKDIFGDDRNLFKRLFYSKYRNENLEKALIKKFGNIEFSNMTTKVMVPVYDVENRRPFFFKSWKESVNDLPLYKVIASTASAPTFFEPTKIRFSHGREVRYLIDGAVAANNPALCAYVEAKRLWGDEDIFVLSIGAGDVSNPLTKPHKRTWGVIDWLQDIAAVFMDGPNDTVDYQLRTLISDLYVRLQEHVDIADTSIDNVSDLNLTRLVEEANQLIRAEKDRIMDVVTLLKSLDSTK